MDLYIRRCSALDKSIREQAPSHQAPSLPQNTVKSKQNQALQLLQIHRTGRAFRAVLAFFAGLARFRAVGAIDDATLR